MSDWSDLAEPVAAAPAAESSWGDLAEPVADAAPIEDQASRTLQRENRALAENTPDQVQRGVANNRVPMSFGENFKQAFSNVSWKNNMFIRLGDYLTNRAQAQEQLQREYDAGVADGSITESRNKWLTPEKVDKLYKAQYTKLGEKPDVPWSELPKKAYDAATSNPGQFFGGMAAAMVEDPQLLWMPELGLTAGVAKAGKAAQAAVRSVEGGAVMGVQSAAVNTVKQLQETGEVHGKEVAQEGATGFVTGTGIIAAAHVVTGIAQAGAAVAAKRKGATIDKATADKIEASMKDKVDAGVSPFEALRQTLEETGWKKEEAAAIVDAVEPQVAKLVEPEKTNATEAGVKQEGSVGEHQGVEGERPATEAGGGDSVVERAPEVKAEEVKQAEVEQPPALKPNEPLPPLEFEKVEVPTEVAGTGKYSDGSPWRRSYETVERTDGSFALVRRVTDADGTRVEYLGPDGEWVKGSPARTTAFGAHAEKSAPTGFKRAEDALAFARDDLGPKQTVETPKLDTKTLPPLKEGEWYHFTRKPGTTDLKVSSANKGNARGEALYLAKDADVAMAHEAPRKDRQGNLGPKVEGELTKTVPGPEIESRLFDESKIFTRDEAKAVLTNAGFLPEEAATMLANKQKISGESLYKILKREFGDVEHAKEQLKAQGYTGNLFKDAAGHQFAAVFQDLKAEPVRRGGNQAGFADPKVLASIGLAGIGGLGVYALTGGDLYKSVAAAVGAGALPFAARIVGRIGRGTAQVVRELTKDTRFPVKHIFRDYARDIGVANYAVDVWGRSVMAMLKGEPDIKASFKKIRDFTQGYRDMELSPREAAAAQELRRFLDYMGEKGMEGKVLRNMIEDYLPGLYQKQPFQKWSDIYDAIVQNGGLRSNMTGMSPRSRHNLHKVIPDYRTMERLIADGTLKLVPLTDNPFEMAAIYAKSMNKSIANRKLIDTLKKTPGPAGYADGTPIPLVVDITTAGAEARIWQAMAIMRDKMDLPKETTDLMAKFAILTAPKDYVHLQHPALEGVRMHKDLVPSMEMLFDTSNPHSIPGKIERGAFATSMAAKSALFSFSLFHAGSLAQVGLAQGLRRPSFWKNIPGAYRATMGTHFAPEMKRAIEAGVTLGKSVNDVDPSFMQKAFNLTAKYAGDLPLAGPVLKAGIEIPKAAHKWMNHFLWDQVHPTLKLASFMTEEAAFARKHPEVTGEAHAKAMREIATGVNDLYGGINWFEMANNVDSAMARNLAVGLFSPKGRRLQQTLLLAPDWNIAAIRAWTEGMQATGAGLTMGKGISRRASDSMYRSYLFMSALTYLGAAYWLQKKLTGESLWDKEDWSVVDMGDGRKIQLNKHFMEGVHLVTDPKRFLLNKLGYVPKESLDQMMGKEYLTTDKTGQVGGPPMEGSRVGHALRNLITPIGATTISDPLAFAAGMIGLPVHGSSYEKREADAPARVESSLDRRAREAARRAKESGKDPEQARQRTIDRLEKDKLKAQESVRRNAAKDEAKREANRAKQ